MPSFSPSPSSTLLVGLVVLLFLARPAHAFGAGNIASISKIEGSNWRHGDIEDTLLTLVMSRAAGGKKFDKLNVSRVYFGNWLRDYSQAVDVGTVKYVSAEAIRILLWVLGFMTFGFGTKEFEVTAERLGCYRPEDHIDNPKDYADNLDARDYDPRLRGPVDERVELAIDSEKGLKNYIASENVGITTSAGHVRKLLTECIRLGRRYNRSRNKSELYEALRLLGTATHCLEDFSAHSNYTELALIELGEQDVFPFVGRNTKVSLPGARHRVYPIITGTFGGVDFLHSVMGEFDDKATQSEISALEGTMQESQSADTSMLKELLSKVPSGIFGSDQSGKADELQANATAAQMQQLSVSPKEPEAFTRQMQQMSKEIYPIIEWHDEVMQSIREAIEKIPILPDLIEQIQDQISIFVFSLLAPFVVPIIEQIKTELNEGSSEIIASSKDKQHNVFYDDNCTDPTHSMISKDHFSNILNEPAGKVASQVLKWAVPQVIQCWDDENINVNRTIDRIINGVFHHPALRERGEDGAAEARHLMFKVVENWWNQKDESEKDEFRDKLSRDGVQEGRNHKEGVEDTGHGCGHPIKMKKEKFAASGPGGAIVSELLSNVGGNSGGGGGGGDSGLGRLAGEAVGGGALGGLVGALAGGVGSNLLGNAFGGNTDAFERESSGNDGSYTKTYTEVGRQGNEYGQAQYSETSYADGGERRDYRRYEQNESEGRPNEGYGYQERVETHPRPGGGWEQTDERVYERPDGGYERETWREREDGGGRRFDEYERRDDGPPGGFGGFGGGRGGYDEPPPPPRDEYGGGYGGGRRDEWGGGGPPREEYGRREEYEEPPRQEYGRRDEYEEPPRRERDEYGGGGGGFGGFGGGEERGEGGGGFFSGIRDAIDEVQDRAEDFGGDEYGGRRDDEYRREERDGGW